MQLTLFDESPEILDNISGSKDTDNGLPDKKFPDQVEVNVNVNTKKIPKDDGPEIDFGDSQDTIPYTHDDRRYTEPGAEAERQVLDHYNFPEVNAQLKSTLTQLAQIRRIVENNRLGLVGLESFLSPVVNGFAGILNVIGHVVNLGKTGLFHGFRDFKRSELMDYTDSNFATMQRLYMAKYVDCMDLMCDRPEGLITTYAKALDAIFAFLDELDLAAKSKQMLEAGNLLLDSVRSQNSTFTTTVSDVYREYGNLSKINSLYSKVETCFSSSRNEAGQVPYRKLYNSQREFTDVVKSLLGKGNTHLRSVAGVFSRLEELEEVITELANTVNEVNLSRSQLDVLSKIARAWAEQFDKFAVVVNDIYRIDHNVTLNVQDLRKHLNM